MLFFFGKKRGSDLKEKEKGLALTGLMKQADNGEVFFWARFCDAPRKIVFQGKEMTQVKRLIGHC